MPKSWWRRSPWSIIVLGYLDSGALHIARMTNLPGLHGLHINAMSCWKPQNEQRHVRGFSSAFHSRAQEERMAPHMCWRHPVSPKSAQGTMSIDEGCNSTYSRPPLHLQFLKWIQENWYGDSFVHLTLGTASIVKGCQEVGHKYCCTHK